MSEILFSQVLLVEDNESHALLIRRALREHCGAIALCPSVASAIELLSSKTFDLIISDLNLPDSEGVGHVEQFRNAGRGAPVVVLTSSTLLEDAVDAMKFGASDFIVKSFEGNFHDAFRLSLSRVHLAAKIERERRKYEREMQILRQAIDSSDDALAVTDQDGKIQWSNVSFARFAERCGGKADNLKSIFTEKISRVESLKAALEKSMSGLAVGASWHSELSLSVSKDEAYDFSISAIDDGRSASFVVWVRDISERKRRERFQREILSTTTHDLKGPLGAIILSSEMLVELLKAETKPRELALRIASAAQGGVNLIDEFLSARRIQEGTFILKPKEQDVGGIISEALLSFEAIAAAKSIALTFEESSGKVGASVDRLGLGRVIGNLLSNACKFTPKGGAVKVTLSQEAEDFCVSVSDTGSGMDSADVKKIFERFSRLSRHGDVPGTGLGLFVVKSIVTAHGGKIEVQSKVGEGTTFSLIIPKQPPVNERGELISLDFT